MDVKVVEGLKDLKFEVLLFNVIVVNGFLFGVVERLSRVSNG